MLPGGFRLPISPDSPIIAKATGRSFSASAASKEVDPGDKFVYPSPTDPDQGDFPVQKLDRKRNSHSCKVGGKSSGSREKGGFMRKFSRKASLKTQHHSPKEENAADPIEGGDIHPEFDHGETGENSKQSSKKKKKEKKKSLSRHGSDAKSSDRQIRSRLKKFISKRPTMESLKESGIIKDNVFGCPLETLCGKEKTTIPNFIRTCVSEVEKRGLDMDGIYRGCAISLTEMRHPTCHNRNGKIFI